MRPRISITAIRGFVRRSVGLSIRNAFSQKMPDTSYSRYRHFVLFCHYSQHLLFSVARHLLTAPLPIDSSIIDQDGSEDRERPSAIAFEDKQSQKGSCGCSEKGTKDIAAHLEESSLPAKEVEEPLPTAAEEETRFASDRTVIDLGSTGPSSRGSPNSKKGSIFRLTRQVT